MRALRALAALLLTAAMLTGCMKIEMDLTVSKDSDTINGSMIFAFDKSILTLGGQSPEKGFGSLSGQADGLPAGSRVEVYDDGKFYGQRIIFDNLSFAEFNKSAAKDPQAPKLVHENGRYIFTMKVNTAAGELGEQAKALAGQLANVTMRFTVTFPGKVIEHDSNAKVDGDTASWTLTMNHNYDLRAVAEEPRAVPWLLVSIGGGLLCLALLAVIAFVAFRLTRRPRPAEETVPAADM